MRVAGMGAGVRLGTGAKDSPQRLERPGITAFGADAGTAARKRAPALRPAPPVRLTLRRGGSEDPAQGEQHAAVADPLAAVARPATGTHSFLSILVPYQPTVPVKPA